ncbi:NUDIX hydrolase [Candidatus Parcubacteria bacterium]|nr:NUDIX hydrolase [Candidatus Parcubacteria bacterium]
MNNIVRKRNPGEPVTIPNGLPKIIYRGKLGAIVQFPVLQDLGFGYQEKTFEKFSRPPGTRLIIVKDEKILLNKEHRLESEGYDWRLPGGKVFDLFEEYEGYIGSEVPKDLILNGARKELREETGLDSEVLNIFDRQICGASVEWDLYYVVAKDVKDFVLEGHNEGEDIDDSRWFSFSEVREMCQSGVIQEGRSVAVLIKFIKD